MLPSGSIPFSVNESEVLCRDIMKFKVITLCLMCSQGSVSESMMSMQESTFKQSHILPATPPFDGLKKQQQQKEMTL